MSLGAQVSLDAAGRNHAEHAVLFEAAGGFRSVGQMPRSSATLTGFPQVSQDGVDRRRRLNDASITSTLEKTSEMEKALPVA
jgi:hypothetical protein